MDTQQLINQATEEARVTFTAFDPRRIAEAIEAGLIDGDRVHLGGKLVAHIHGSDVAMVNDDIETARMPLDKLSEQQRDRMLVRKAVRASRVGVSTGRM